MEDVHVASYDMKARVRLMDDLGIAAQVIYPNVAGFGNQNFVQIEDEDLDESEEEESDDDADIARPVHYSEG